MQSRYSLHCPRGPIDPGNASSSSSTRKVASRSMAALTLWELRYSCQYQWRFPSRRWKCSCGCSTVCPQQRHRPPASSLPARSVLHSRKFTKALALSISVSMHSRQSPWHRGSLRNWSMTCRNDGVAKTKAQGVATLGAAHRLLAYGSSWCGEGLSLFTVPGSAGARRASLGKRLSSKEPLTPRMAMTFESHSSQSHANSRDKAPRSRRVVQIAAVCYTAWQTHTQARKCNCERQMLSRLAQPII